MEQDNSGSLFELQVDHESTAYFREAARWSKFISIIYFICIAFFLLALLFAGSMILGTGAGNRMLESDPAFNKAVTKSPIAIAFGVIIALGFFALFIYGGLMLYRFGNYCREGVERQDQLTFNQGLKSLRNYFICTGVIAVAGIINDLISLSGI